MRRLVSALKGSRNLFGSLLEVAGVALLALAAYRLDPIAGIAVAGLGLIVLGLGLGSE